MINRESVLLQMGLKKIEGKGPKKETRNIKNGFILHQGNPPTHTALSVQKFLTEKQIPTFDHPPYSPDLASCDFFLFPKRNKIRHCSTNEKNDCMTPYGKRYFTLLLISRKSE